MKASVKLDIKLIKSAKEEAAKEHRTAASQIERWASMGQRLDADRRDASLLLSSVWAEMDSSAFKERYKNYLENAESETYGKSKAGKGFIDKIEKSGARSTGRMVNGKFVKL